MTLHAWRHGEVLVVHSGDRMERYSASPVVLSGTGERPVVHLESERCERCERCERQEEAEKKALEAGWTPPENRRKELGIDDC